MQAGISDQVKDALSSSTLLLVFVTVLFNAKYAEIRTRIADPRPNTPDDVATWRTQMFDCLVNHVAPVLLVSGGAALIFLPVVRTIVSERHLAYWDGLDFGVTTFVFVSVVVACLAVWSLIRAVQLLGKIAGASQYIKTHKR